MTTEVESQTNQKEKEVKLVDIAVVDENAALNLMVSFLSLANKRGAFSIVESAKIWECISKFQKPVVEQDQVKED